MYEIGMLYLQDTHLTKQEERYFKQIFSWEIGHVSVSACSKGVIMLNIVKSTVSWVLKTKVIDEGGWHYHINKLF